jgi:hypothetical protein
VNRSSTLSPSPSSSSSSSSSSSIFKHRPHDTRKRENQKKPTTFLKNSSKDYTIPINNFRIICQERKENDGPIDAFYRYMSAVQQHPSSIVSPEEVASAMNAAFAEFLAVEPAAAAAALLIHHQQNVNPTPLNDFPTNGTTHNNNASHDLTRNSRPPTPYAMTTHTYSGKNSVNIDFLLALFSIFDNELTI